MISLIMLIFIFACYGFSNVIVYSNGPGDIFSKWRDLANKIHPKFGELFGCMMCLPMWVGFILSTINIVFFGALIAFTPMNLLLIYFSVHGVFISILAVLIDGAIASGTSWFIHNVEEYFESRQ